MCRMIAAVGKFNMGLLISAMRAMAANDNPAYDHELRGEGDAIQHDCGWGAAFVEGGGLARRRSAASCLDDPEFEDLSKIETGRVLLHARRNKDRTTIDVVNSHPFVAEWRGHGWAFCHNGEVTDRSQLDGDASLVPEGSIDSELLFHHLLARLDSSDPAACVERALGRLVDFTCLNSFLMSAELTVAYARKSPGTPRPLYYTLWRGVGDGFVVASSEVVGGLDVDWEPFEDGSASILVSPADY